MHARVRRIAIAIAALAASTTLGVTLVTAQTSTQQVQIADHSWCC